MAVGTSERGALRGKLRGRSVGRRAIMSVGSRESGRSAGNAAVGRGRSLRASKTPSKPGRPELTGKEARDASREVEASGTVIALVISKTEPVGMERLGSPEMAGVPATGTTDGTAMAGTLTGSVEVMAGTAATSEETAPWPPPRPPRTPVRPLRPRP